MNKQEMVRRLEASRVSLEGETRWDGFSELLSILDAIGRGGATAVVKIDGSRPEGLMYTVVVSGGHLGDSYFRKDAGDLAQLMREAVMFYIDRSSSSQG